eukprot:6667511-Pyramimonas_sp.AAC.1
MGKKFWNKTCQKYSIQKDALDCDEGRWELGEREGHRTGMRGQRGGMNGLNRKNVWQGPCAI